MSKERKSKSGAIYAEFTDEQKHNLAQTAIYMLSDTKRTLTMIAYGSDKNGTRITPYKMHECGTACCFAGYGPIALNNVRKSDSWARYITRTFAIDWNSATGDEIHDFLFSTDWADDRKQAAARAILFLENDCIVPDRAFAKDTWVASGYGVCVEKRFLTKLSKASLVARLKPFLKS